MPRLRSTSATRMLASVNEVLMASTPAAAIEVDPEAAGLFNRPDYFDQLRRLRREAPVRRYAPHSWTVATYDDVRAISRDPQRFRSGGGVLMNDPLRSGEQLPGSILHMDPPDHAAWRKIASRWFTPKASAALVEHVRSKVTRVFDGLEPKASDGQTVDLVEELAAPIPVHVIADLLGIDDRDRNDFRRWSDACIESPETDSTEAAVLVGELLGFLNEHIARRRAEPGDDMLTTLVASEVDGRPLEDHEVSMYCLSLLVAGNETTRHLLSGAMLALHDHRDQRARLTRESAASGDSVFPQDGAALGDAVEECLRWVTPIQSFGRTATVDLELGGEQIEAGDWVVMLYASANRDENVFGDDAETFDSARPANPAHLAFGFGEHLCLGASLARLEARLFLAELLNRYPEYTITGEPTWTTSTLVRGMRHLPAVLA